MSNPPSVFGEKPIREPDPRQPRPPAPLQYDTCPFQPRSSLLVVGNERPGDACVRSCKLYIQTIDPRTGQPNAPPVCAISLMAVQLASLTSLVARYVLGQEEIPGKKPEPPPPIPGA